MQLPVVQPWFAEGLQFECNGCGNCCTGGPGFVWISDVEIARAAAYLQVTQDQFRRTYCRKLEGKVSLREKRPNAKGEYDCVFLKELPPEPGPDGKPFARRICEIYPVRPLQCRTFPFWEGTLANPRAWKRTAERCPGINVGRKWSHDEMVARRDAEDWPEDTK